MVFQDPTGALNPRQTIYESVAEGLRIHKVHGDEERQVGTALAAAGCVRPSGSSSSTPTSCRAGSANGW